MANKTLAEKAVEIAELNAALTAKVTELTAKIAEDGSVIAGLQGTITDLTAKVSACESVTTSLNEKNSALTAERDTLAAQIKTLSDTLALAPQSQQPTGTDPVDDGAVGDPAKVSTWQQALAACGGDYVKARNQYTEVFDAFIESHKNDRK